MHKRKDADEEAAQLSIEIDRLKKELDLLIERGEDFPKIYEASKKLDILIVRYYSLRGNAGDSE